MYESRRRLQIAAYFDDLPLGAGGLHLWPGSHQRIWDRWSAMHRGDIPSNDDWLSLRHSAGKFDGYVTPPISEIKEDTPVVDTHGPCGSVVLWHANMLHMAGQNTSSDIIRQATIYAYDKTEESLPDELALGLPGRRPVARLVRRAARDRNGELETDRREHAGHRPRWSARFTVVS